jgi:hypothetical protein
LHHGGTSLAQLREEHSNPFNDEDKTLLVWARDKAHEAPDFLAVVEANPIPAWWTWA